MKTVEIITALSNFYCAPEWSFFTEFQPEPGFSGMCRRMDGLAIGIWPKSKYGHCVLGFEVKVSRADLLNDKKNPDKFAETYATCDQTFYVTPQGLTDTSEIPKGAGLIEVLKTGELTFYGPEIKKGRQCSEGVAGRYCQKK